MANGPNWQTIAGIAAISGVISGLGTGTVFTANTVTPRDIASVGMSVKELKERVTAEVNRLDGWVGEVAGKQDDVRERLTVVEAKTQLQELINNIIIRLERLERKEELRP